MTTNTVIEKFDMLPDIMKSEASLFIDFLLYKSNLIIDHKERIPGFLEGKISITDDFAEPIEDFKDCM
jgi:hypothetical protein